MIHLVIFLLDILHLQACGNPNYVTFFKKNCSLGSMPPPSRYGADRCTVLVVYAQADK